MSKIFNNKYLLTIIRLFLGFMFIFAAVTKISDPEGFSQAIYNYKIIPLSFVNILAIILPWIELCAGILMIFGISVKENSAIIFGLLLIFIIAITISLFRGLDISCGCFGTVNGSRVGLLKILENIGLLFLSIILIKFDAKFLSIQNNDKN